MLQQPEESAAEEASVLPKGDHQHDLVSNRNNRTQYLATVSRCESELLFLFFITWFPSPDSGLHGELDDGDSVDGELIVEKRSLEAKIVTRQINRPLPSRRGVATQRWFLDVSRRRICKAWIVQQSESFSNKDTSALHQW